MGSKSSAAKQVHHGEVKDKATKRASQGEEKDKATKRASLGEEKDKDAKRAKKDAKRQKKAAKRESMVVPAGLGEASSETDPHDDVEEIELETDVTRETLEGTPLRCLTFLKAIGICAPIRAALGTKGYRQEDHQEGWDLLHRVSGYHSAPVVPEDNSVRDAIQAIDAWDEDGFRVISATLKSRFPEQARFVLDGLTASTGAAAVLGVKQLLDRLDALEKGSERTSSRGRDHAALEVLARRGIDAEERARLRSLIATAETAPETSVSPAALAEADSEYLKGLIALRNWFEEWSAIARVVVRRRDYLIRMGLARRQTQTPVDPPQPSVVAV